MHNWGDQYPNTIRQTLNYLASSPRSSKQDMLLLVTILLASCLLFSPVLFRKQTQAPVPRGRIMTSHTFECGHTSREDMTTLITSEHGDYEWPSSQARVSFGSGAGAIVQGFPSTGGLYVLESCSGVELDFLGLDRFVSAKRSFDPVEEDAHCMNMRKLGAKWWESESDYFEANMAVVYPYPDEPVLYVGWPASGGVWVIRSTREDSMRKGYGRVKSAFSMEEYCREIKRLGGVFYEDPKTCPDLDLA